MQRAGITVVVALVAFSSLVVAAPSNKGKQGSAQLIAKASHVCGERRYEVEDAPLNEKDEDAIRNIISFLYDGANILFEYPGAPSPTMNDQTRRSMENSDYVKNQIKHQLNYRNIPNPSAQEMDQEMKKFYSLDAVSWNIHEGPRVERIEQILAEKNFTKRLGPQAVKLIESRLNGERGQRPQILMELTKHFNVKEVANYWENENCEILGGFGPD